MPGLIYNRTIAWFENLGGDYSLQENIDEDREDVLSEEIRRRYTVGDHDRKPVVALRGGLNVEFTKVTWVEVRNLLRDMARSGMIRFFHPPYRNDDYEFGIDGLGERRTTLDSFQYASTYYQLREVTNPGPGAINLERRFVVDRLGRWKCEAQTVDEAKQRLEAGLPRVPNRVRRAPSRRIDFGADPRAGTVRTTLSTVISPADRVARENPFWSQPLGIPYDDQSQVPSLVVPVVKRVAIERNFDFS